MVNTERRYNYPVSDVELFTQDDIELALKRERRIDELQRLQEVREQKRLWWRTIIFCGLLNVFLLLCALIGAFGYAP